MVLNISVPDLKELKPKITVFGVGGAGGNAINNMISSGLAGVEFVAANTDAQALTKSLSDSKMQLGVQITKGLGAGSHPDIGKSSADETKHEIMERLEGTNMLFITAGMGGGTGTGAAPVIARVAKELGILTVAVVTKPFQFEGAGRMRIAEQGLKELECLVDTTIVIPNQNLFRVADEKTTFADAFSMADEVLHAGVRSITDLMVVPGLINLDFADVKTIMNDMGRAMMGTGQASGEKRARECARAAVANPLLDDFSLDGAKGLLINITGGTDLTLHEVDQITNEIREQVHPDADVIVGSIFDESLEGSARVSVVATGLDTTPRSKKRVVDLNMSTNAIVSENRVKEDFKDTSIRSENLNISQNIESTEPYVYLDENESIDESNELAETETEAKERKMTAEAEEARIAAEAEERRMITEAEEARIAAEAKAKADAEAEERRMVIEAEEARIAAEAVADSEAEEARIAAEAVADSEAEEARIAAEAKAEDDTKELDNEHTSIFDLIENEGSEVKTTPDLFTNNNIHELDISQEEDEDLENKKVNTDDILDEELLEIPAFLRRQSK